MRMNRKYVPYLIILGVMIVINLLDWQFQNFEAWIYKQLLNWEILHRNFRDALH